MLGFNTLTSMAQGLGSSLEDPNGGTSQRRLFSLLWAVMLCGSVTWLVWETGKFPELPEAYVYITVTLVCGILFQKPLENYTQEKTPTP